VQDISRRDMRLFYDAHYHPNHATLVLVGDITAEEARPVVTELFGDLPRGPEVNRPKPQEIKLNGPKTL
jgi:zinc protease